MQPKYSLHLGAWFSCILPLWMLLVATKTHAMEFQKETVDSDIGVDVYTYMDGDRRAFLVTTPLSDPFRHLIVLGDDDMPLPSLNGAILSGGMFDELVGLKPKVSSKNLAVSFIGQSGGKWDMLSDGDDAVFVANYIEKFLDLGYNGIKTTIYGYKSGGRMAINLMNKNTIVENHIDSVAINRAGHDLPTTDKRILIANALFDTEVPTRYEQGDDSLWYPFHSDETSSSWPHRPLTGHFLTDAIMLTRDSEDMISQKDFDFFQEDYDCSTQELEDKETCEELLGDYANNPNGDDTIETKYAFEITTLNFLNDGRHPDRASFTNYLISFANYLDPRLPALRHEVSFDGNKICDDPKTYEFTSSVEHVRKTEVSSSATVSPGNECGYTDQDRGQSWLMSPELCKKKCEDEPKCVEAFFLSPNSLPDIKMCQTILHEDSKCKQFIDVAADEAMHFNVDKSPQKISWKMADLPEAEYSFPIGTVVRFDGTIPYRQVKNKRKHKRCVTKASTPIHTNIPVVLDSAGTTYFIGKEKSQCNNGLKTKMTVEGCSLSEAELTYKLNPDAMAIEHATSYRIKKDGKMMVKSTSLTTYTENTVCVPKTACIEFILRDQGKDGVCCENGRGYVHLHYKWREGKNGRLHNLYYNMNEFSTRDTRLFFGECDSSNNREFDSDDEFDTDGNSTATELELDIDEDSIATEPAKVLESMAATVGKIGLLITTLLDCAL